MEVQCLPVKRIRIFYVYCITRLCCGGTNCCYAKLSPTILLQPSRVPRIYRIILLNKHDVITIQSVMPASKYNFISYQS
jgi:hypothetical protein